MAKVALAEVLWRAANTFLLPDNEFEIGMDWYSCNAVAFALKRSNYVDIKRHPVMQFLTALGCKPDSGLAFERQGLKWGRECQSARYIWLLLAMKVAEDEQIYIEV
jgi:hypothetical protein